MHELTSDLCKPLFFNLRFSTFSATGHMLTLSPPRMPDLLLSGDRNHSSFTWTPDSHLNCSWSSRVPPHQHATHLSDSTRDQADKGIKLGLDLYMSPDSLLAPNNSDSRLDVKLIIPKPPSAACLLMHSRVMTTGGPHAWGPPHQHQHQQQTNCGYSSVEPPRKMQVDQHVYTSATHRVQGRSGNGSFVPPHGFLLKLNRSTSRSRSGTRVRSSWIQKRWNQSTANLGAACFDCIHHASWVSPTKDISS